MASRLPVPAVVRTTTQLSRVVEEVLAYPEVVLDVETSSLDPITNEVLWVGLAVPSGVHIIPTGHPVGDIVVPAHKVKRVPPPGERKILKSGKESMAKKTYNVPAVFGDPGPQLRPDVVLDALAPIFAEGRTIVGHNLKFDIKSLYKYLGYVPNVTYEDTMLMAFSADENLSKFDLKSLALDHMRAPRDPKVRAQIYPAEAKGGILDKPFSSIARYLSQDVWYTLRLYQHFRKVLRRERVEESYRVDMDLYPVLIRMELAGIGVDDEMLAQRGVELDHEIRAIAGRAWSICGESFPMTNLNKKRHYLFSKKKDGGQGLKPLNTTATGLPQLNQATLEEYAETNELASLFLEWSKKDKLYSTFITGIGGKLVGDGELKRLHTNLNQHRTVTSRLSSSDPNLQQIPKKDVLRKAFRAAPGYKFIVSDYSQIELRCIAYLTEDPVMVDTIVSGKDIHAEAAAAMFRVPLEEVTEDQRAVGKTFNFGTAYGAGPSKVAQVANCTLDEASEMIDNYYQRFETIARWKNKLIHQAKKNGDRENPYWRPPYITIPPFDRKRRIRNLYSQDTGDYRKAERQVVNSVVQGFAAYIMKLALIDVQEGIDAGAIPGAKLLLTVHDELIAEVPEDLADEALDYIKTTMESVSVDGEPVLGEIPLEADAKIADNWADGK